MQTEQTKRPDIKDSVIEKIAQTYLSDTKEEDYSLHYRRLKRNVSILGFAVLAILVICMGIFIFSAQRIDVAITVSPLEEIVKDSAKKEALSNYQYKIELLNPRIARAHFGGASSLSSKLEMNSAFISLQQNGGKAWLLLNFKRPMDFSNGILFFKTNAARYAGRLRLVFRDVNYQSNVREGEVIIVESGKRDKDVLLRPNKGSSGLDLKRISQVRFELQSASQPERGQTTVYIKDLAFLAQKGGQKE